MGKKGLASCLIGLGNIGRDYVGTRHNIGFDIVDAFARSYSAKFFSEKMAQYACIKGESTIHLIKPTLLMNRSGESVKFWIKKLAISLDRILVISDDLHLPLGNLRLREKGGSGGHNGLKNIAHHLQTQAYPRLRVGIGNHYSYGDQGNYVLGHFKKSEKKRINTSIIPIAEKILDLFSHRSFSEAVKYLSQTF